MPVLLCGLMLKIHTSLPEFSSIVSRDNTLVDEIHVNGYNISKFMSSESLRPLAGNYFDADFPSRDIKAVLKRNPHCVQDNPV